MNSVEDKRKRGGKDIIVLLVMVISAIYLINPTAGVIEIIPDVVPFVGNLDEGVATTLLLSGLSYFGINLTNIFKK
jgi:uncharacterized membrane protein YkvA (DUF1232 family)